MQSDTLSPCPFCGGKGIPSEDMIDSEKWHVVECITCHARGPIASGRDGARNGWDARANQSVRAAHSFIGVPRDGPPDESNWLCAAYDCRALHLPGKRYCKRHDMRIRRHGDPEVVLKPGRKKQE